jgi:hypothetical protein
MLNNWPRSSRWRSGAAEDEEAFVSVGRDLMVAVEASAVLIQPLASGTMKRVVGAQSVSDESEPYPRCGRAVVA